MKRQNTVIYICVIITLLNVAGLLFIACKSNSPIATASTPVQSSTSGYYSDAYMPEALTFAGETVPLQRLIQTYHNSSPKTSTPSVPPNTTTT